MTGLLRRSRPRPVLEHGFNVTTRPSIHESLLSGAPFMGLLAVSALATGTGRQSKDKNGLVDVRCPEGAHSDSLGRSPRSAIPILVHPLAPAAAKPQQAPRGMEAIWATSTWGCAPGCPRAPLRDSMQRLGGVSTRKVTSHNPKTCASPPAPALPGTSAPQPAKLQRRVNEPAPIQHGIDQHSQAYCRNRLRPGDTSPPGRFPLDYPTGRFPAVPAFSSYDRAE